MFLSIKGKSGKGHILTENFIEEKTLVIETFYNQVARWMERSDYSMSIQIRDNSAEEIEEILGRLTTFYNGLLNEGKGYVNVVFHLNLDQQGVRRIKDFERSVADKFEFVRVIVTESAENEEIEYVEYK